MLQQPQQRSGQKRPRPEGEDAAVESVPQAVLDSTLLYYDNEPMVQQCRQILASAIFPNAWHVGWTADASGGSGPMIFNTPLVKASLQAFVLAALDRLRVHHFVAYWYRRDVAAWMRDAMRAQTPAEKAAVGLPFGLMPPDELRLETRLPAGAGAIFERLYAAAPVSRGDSDLDAAAARRYGFGIFEHGLSLQALPLHELLRAQMYVREMRGAASTSTSESWTTVLRRPASPIYALMERASDVAESRRNLFDADWQRTHPRFLFKTRPPNVANVPPDMMGDGELYAGSSLWRAAAQQAMQQQNWTLAEAASYLDSIKNRARALVTGFRGGAAGGEAMRQRQKDHYDRPDGLDDALPLPEFVDLAHAPDAAVVNDARLEQQSYRMEVLSFMGMPESVLTRGSTSGSKSGTGKTLTGDKSNEMHALYYLEQAVGEQRMLAQRFFAHVWLSCLGPFQMLVVDQWLVDVEDALSVVDGDTETSVVDSMVTFRQHLKQLRVRHQVLHEAEATLVFPMQGTLRQTEDFATQLSLADRGYVDVKELEKSARGALGQHIKLREPPPDPPTTSGPGPAKKKAKKTKKPAAGKGGPAEFIEKTPLQRVMETGKK